MRWSQGRLRGREYTIDKLIPLYRVGEEVEERTAGQESEGELRTKTREAFLGVPIAIVNEVSLHSHLPSLSPLPPTMFPLSRWGFHFLTLHADPNFGVHDRIAGCG